MEEKRPNLHKLLQERLPALGLDAEMYGPYVWGDEDADSDDDDKDDDELQEVVLGVLQASSETHAEDDGVWLELIQQIHASNKLDSQLKREQREKHLQETKTKMEEDLARAKLEEQSKPKPVEAKKSSAVDDEQKRILLAKYGYDEPAEEEEGSGFGGNASGAAKKSASAPTTANNKDAAKVAYMEKSKELRGAQKATKAEERKKTKEQKANKAQLKEARRKRATKGERKA